jgi:hypothetical protein
MTFLLYPCKNLFQVAKIKPCLTKPVSKIGGPLLTNLFKVFNEKTKGCGDTPVIQEQAAVMPQGSGWDRRRRYSFCFKSDGIEAFCPDFHRNWRRLIDCSCYYIIILMKLWH